MSEKVTHIIGSPAAEKKLVAGLLRGDESSYRQLYDVFAPRVRGTLLRLLRDRTTVEDAIQASFLIVFRRVDTFDHRASLLSWITRIGIREGIRLARAANRFSGTDLPDLPEDVDSPETQAIDRQLGEHLAVLLAALPDTKRVPLLLFETEGFTVGEIAEMLGEPRGTILSRLGRTRAELRAAFAALESGTAGIRPVKEKSR